VELGKPAQGHSEQTRFAEIYITSQLPNAEELLKAHKYVERFHTNFYHAFLGQQEFDELASKIRQLIEALDTALKQRLEELEGPFGTWVPSSSDE
jgi:hypothetical protein